MMRREYQMIEDYPMAVRTLATLQTLPKYAAIGLGAIALTACASSGGNVATGNGDYEDAIGAYTNPAADSAHLDPVAAAAFWGTRYNRDQKDPEVSVKYAAALRKIGSVAEAVSVMSTAATYHPDNPDVHLESGKALIEAGRAFEAVRHLEIAAATKSSDWTALSAYGVALDNIGEHDLARAKYDQALMLAPNSISVMNNKALSYALSGDLSLAERTLRAASTNRGADARVRQNLALVLALKGDMQGAERLARSDLPPQIANQNIEYFRSLMNQPAYWAEYAPENFDAPAFKPATETPKAKEPKVSPAPMPELREETKPEKKEQEKGAPIALKEAAPVTKASTTQIENKITAPAPILKEMKAEAVKAEPMQLTPPPELKSDK